MVADGVFRGLFKFLLLAMVIGAGACATTPPKTALLPPPDIEPILAAAEERRDVPKAAHGDDAVANPLAIFEARNQCAVEVGCDGGVCRVLQTIYACDDISQEKLLRIGFRSSTKDASKTLKILTHLAKVESFQLKSANGANTRLAMNYLFKDNEIWTAVAQVAEEAEDLLRDGESGVPDYWEAEYSVGSPQWLKGHFETTWTIPDPNSNEKMNLDPGADLKKVQNGALKIIANIQELIEFDGKDCVQEKFAKDIDRPSKKYHVWGTHKTCDVSVIGQSVSLECWVRNFQYHFKLQLPKDRVDRYSLVHSDYAPCRLVLKKIQTELQNWNNEFPNRDKNGGQASQGTASS